MEFFCHPKNVDFVTALIGADVILLDNIGAVADVDGDLLVFALHFLHPIIEVDMIVVSEHKIAELTHKLL